MITIDIPDTAVEDLVARIVAGLGVAVTPTTSSCRYATVQEAAEYLRCKPQRIYDLVSARQVAVLKDGKRSLFRYDDLDAILRERS